MRSPKCTLTHTHTHTHTHTPHTTSSSHQNAYYIRFVKRKKKKRKRKMTLTQRENLYSCQSAEVIISKNWCKGIHKTNTDNYTNSLQWIKSECHQFGAVELIISRLDYCNSLLAGVLSIFFLNSQKYRTMLQDSFSKQPDLPTSLLCFVLFTGYLLSKGLNTNCLCFGLK